MYYWKSFMNSKLLERPFLPWVCMYKYVGGGRTLCRLVPLELYLRRSRNRKLAQNVKKKNIPPCNLNFPLFIQIFHFVTTWEEYRRLILIYFKFSHCWSLYLCSETCSAKHCPLVAERTWKQTHIQVNHWVQLNLDLNKNYYFPNNKKKWLYTTLSTVQSCDQINPQCQTQTAPKLLSSRLALMGWWPNIMRSGDISNWFLSEALRSVCFCNSEIKQRRHSASLYPLKMSAIFSASR